MPTFEQDWISPILEAFKKEKIVNNYSIVLGLNPLGQSLCRQLYEENRFESILIFNSPSFSTWNRYPVSIKPPVIPVHGMVNEDLMLVFGDVIIKDYEWVTDMLFYLRGNVPNRFTIAFMAHENPSCGIAVSSKGRRLLERMEIPPGDTDFYDGLVAPLLSVGPVADLDPVVIFLETRPEREIILQVDDIAVSQDEVDRSIEILDRGLDLRLP